MSWRPRISLIGALVAMGVMAVLLGVNMTPKKMVVSYYRRGALVVEYEYGWPATMRENARLIDEAKDTRFLAEYWRRPPPQCGKRGQWSEEDMLAYGKFVDVEFDGEWRWGGLAANIAVGLAIALTSGVACEYVVRRRLKETVT